MSLATALGSAGRLEDARATLLAAIDAMPDDAPELRARAATFVARVDHALGRQGEARLLLERALGDLPQQRSRAAATLELELAMDQLFSAELGPVRDRAQAVLSSRRSSATRSWRPPPGPGWPMPSRTWAM